MDGYISKRAAHRLIDNREYDLSNPIQKDLFHNAVNNLPSADAQHWIPCSERTTEIEYTEHSLKISKYLVTMLRTTKDKKCSGARVDFALFMPEREGDKWEGGTWQDGWLVSNEKYDTEVIAWMPMPKPYDPIDGEMNSPEGECNDGARATYE